MRCCCKISFAFSRDVPTGTVTRSSEVIHSDTVSKSLVSKRISRFVIIPTRRSFFSTGRPLILYSAMIFLASIIVEDSSTVIGFNIIPLSDRLTRSTIFDCSSIDKFLWITPIPPVLASAIAISLSVTVSIAALSIGIFSSILLVKRVFRFTSLGNTFDFCGTNSTSSKVNACLNGGRLLTITPILRF